jgi:WhiB family redox-sensing transcriptional regulator
MTATTATQTWLDRAACLDVDPDLFFPTSHGSGTKNDHPDWTAPRAICARCTVIGPCLEEALNAVGVDAGMRAGLTPRQRTSLTRSIRRQTRTTSMQTLPPCSEQSCGRPSTHVVTDLGDETAAADITKYACDFHRKTAMAIAVSQRRSIRLSRIKIDGAA